MLYLLTKCSTLRIHVLCIKSPIPSVDCFIRVYCDWTRLDTVYTLLQIQYQCRAGLSATDLIAQGNAFTHSLSKLIKY